MQAFFSIWIFAQYTNSCVAFVGRKIKSYYIGLERVHRHTHTLSIRGVGNTRDSLRLSARSASDGPVGSAASLQM